MMEGNLMAEIDQLVAEGFKSGRLIALCRAGVAYMAFPRHQVRQQEDEVSSFPPEAMFWPPT